MEKLFRLLIILSSAAYIIWFFQPYYPTGLYTEEIRDLLGADGYSGMDLLLKYSVEIGWAWLILYLISAIGIFLYIKAARILFTILFFLALLLPLLYGVSVQSHIDVVLINIMSSSDAVILYMCYLSSITSKFTTHNKSFNPDVANDAPPG